MEKTNLLSRAHILRPSMELKQCEADEVNSITGSEVRHHIELGT